MELNKLNLLLSLESANCDVESSLSRLGCETSVMGDLITDYTASGVKWAGTSCGVVYGTREVTAVLLTFTGTQTSGINEAVVAD